MSRQKIVFITNMYPTNCRPGFGTFVRNSVEGLRQIGCDVEVRSLTSHGAGFGGYIAFYLATFFYLLRVRGVAYVHYVSHSSPPVLAALALNSNLKLVLHYHGSDAFPERHEPLFRQRVKWLSCAAANKFASGVIAPSRGFMNKLMECFDLSEVPSLINPSGGVDRAVFYRETQVQRSTAVIFAGRMIEGKGAEDAAAVVQSLMSQSPVVHAVFVGTGPSRIRVEDMLSQHRERGAVTYYDLLPQDRLAAEFRKSEVILFPSTREGESLGLVWIEAALCGAIPLLMRNGSSGDLLPVHLASQLICENVEDMEMKARMILADPSVREHLRVELFSALHAEYDSRSVSTHLKEFLAEVSKVDRS